MSDFDLGQLIRDTLTRSREPDPHVIARRLIPRIPDEEVRAIMVECLHDLVRQEIRRARQALSEPTGGSASPSPSRWERYRYKPGGEWKLLADCTAEDCDLLADEYAERKEREAALERRFRNLAALLRAHNAATVGDLGEDLEQAA